MDVPATSSRQRRGNAAEQRAEQWLNRQGMVTVARNWRCRMGEIDLVMLDDDILVFVEVRYRSSQNHGGAVASVDQHKQRRLAAAARHYLRLHPEAALRRCRFDVVALQPGATEDDDLDWISGAFYAS